MIRLLAHPPSPLSRAQVVFLSLLVCHRSSLPMGEGGRGYKTGRQPSLLKIIMYSLFTLSLKITDGDACFAYSIPKYNREDGAAMHLIENKCLTTLRMRSGERGGM
jgi:hypothetical protein